MRCVLVATSVILIMSGSQAVQAAPVITTYGTSATFDAANPGATLEMFGVEIAPGFNNVPTTYDYGGFTIAKEYVSNNNTGSGIGRWRGRPTVALADVITFDSPLVAWGARFDTQDGGNGVGVELRIEVEVSSTRQTFLLGTVGAGADPNIAFLGFMSDTPFDTLRITSVPNGNDTYSLTEMRYVATVGSPDPSVDVPAPSGIALLAAGLLGLGAFRTTRDGARITP